MNPRTTYEFEKSTIDYMTDTRKYRKNAVPRNVKKSGKVIEPLQ